MSYRITVFSLVILIMILVCLKLILESPERMFRIHITEPIPNSIAGIESKFEYDVIAIKFTTSEKDLNYIIEVKKLNKIQNVSEIISPKLEGIKKYLTIVEEISSTLSLKKLQQIDTYSNFNFDFKDGFSRELKFLDFLFVEEKKPVEAVYVHIPLN